MGDHQLCSGLNFALEVRAAAPNGLDTGLLPWAPPWTGRGDIGNRYPATPEIDQRFGCFCGRCKNKNNGPLSSSRRSLYASQRRELGERYIGAT